MTAGHMARSIAGAALGYTLFASVILWPQITQLRSVPDLGDPLFSIWRLGWVYQQLSGDPRRLFDANIFHPEAGSLAFSDSMLLPGAAASPFHLAGLHPVLIYNLLLIASFIVTAVCTFALVRRLTGSAGAAFVSGLIFGFYPYRFEHFSHLELQMTMWMPGTLLALHRFTVQGRREWAIAAALLWAAQFYSSMYYGVFLALFAAVVALVWMVRTSVPWRKLLLPAAGASVLALTLAMPLALVHARSGPVRQGRPAAEVLHYSATPMDFLRAHRGSAFWANLTPPGRQEERQLFPGATILLLAALGVIVSHERTRWGLLAGGVLAFDASLGANGFTYPVLAAVVPGFHSMRVPARFSVLVGLSLAALAGYAVARLPAGRARILGIAVAVVGISIDVWPVLRLRPVWAAPPPIYASLPPSPVVLAEFPAGGRPERFPATPYLYFSSWHWRTMINGYSGYLPTSYVDALDTLEHFPADETVTLLRMRGVTHVTVNCELFASAGYEGRCGRTLSAAAARSDLREVARATWQGRPVVLFELLPGAGAASPAGR